MSEKTFRVLITGGSGFIGTNLVEYLLNAGYIVMNIDLEPPKKQEHEEFWCKLSLLDRKELDKKILQFSPEYVVHLAARTDLSGKTMADYAVNTEGTMNLASSLVAVSGLRNVLFTSSMLVCGPGYIPSSQTDYAPTTVYGESKMRMEQLLRQSQLPFRWSIIRPTSIWGPWFGTPYRDFFDRVLRKRMYNIERDLSATKTYGFVLNAVFQIEKLLLNDRIYQETFYIGDDPPLNINDWAGYISEKAGLKQPVTLPFPILKAAAVLGDLFVMVGIPFPLTSFRLKNMTTNNVLPLNNLVAVTGSAPYSLADGVDITLGWIKNNQ
jgi:nucleoside-diphosphate-sugar epimerase